MSLIPHVKMEGMSPEQIAMIQHWSTYGQCGKTPDHRVRPHEWNHKAMLKPVTTPWHIKLDPQQLPLLLLGFTPATPRGMPLELFLVGEMVKTHIFMSTSQRSDLTPSEDKWFIYADGPDHAQQARIHMCRSWTGFEMMELLVDAGYDGYGSDGGGARIVSISWENDEGRRMRDQNAAFSKEVAREVCDWVLGVKLGPAEAEDDLLGARRRVVPTSKGLNEASGPLPTISGSTYRFERPQRDQ